MSFKIQQIKRAIQRSAVLWRNQNLVPVIFVVTADRQWTTIAWQPVSLFVQQQRAELGCHISWKGSDSVTANEASDCALLFIENIGYYI
jgi:hypothetical protein